MSSTTRDGLDWYGQDAAIAEHLPIIAGNPYTVTLFLTTWKPLPDDVEVRDESSMTPAALADTIAMMTKVSITVLIATRRGDILLLVFFSVAMINRFVLMERNALVLLGGGN